MLVRLLVVVTLGGLVAGCAANVPAVSPYVDCMQTMGSGYCYQHDFHRRNAFR